MKIYGTFSKICGLKNRPRRESEEYERVKSENTAPPKQQGANKDLARWAYLTVLANHRAAKK